MAIVEQSIQRAPVSRTSLQSSLFRVINFPDKKIKKKEKIDEMTEHTHAEKRKETKKKYCVYVNEN